MDIHDSHGFHNLHHHHEHIPIFCSLHGKQLEFVCYDCNMRICLDCQKSIHINHKFDLASTMVYSVNDLRWVQSNAKHLHRDRQQIYDCSYKGFKAQIRSEVLKLQKESTTAIEETTSRILQLINKGEIRNFEKEMEIYQNFVLNKIINF